MSFNGLMNHRVRVYREPDPLANVDDTGHVPTRPEPLAADGMGFNARPHQRWMGDQRDRGPGEQQDRLRTWYLRKEVEVAERDVLLVTAGEEAGSTWRVVSLVPVHGYRRLHHKEANCERWVGRLSED